MVLVIIFRARIGYFGYTQIPGKYVKGGSIVDDFKISSKIQGGGLVSALFDPFAIGIIKKAGLNTALSMVLIDLSMPNFKPIKNKIKIRMRIETIVQNIKII